MGTPFRASSRLISDRLDGGARGSRPDGLKPLILPVFADPAKKRAR